MENCKNCGKPENKQISPCLLCKLCKRLVHLECLILKKTPGNFYDDIFFDYTCADCSFTKTEVFKRDKMSWLFVIAIALNHLSKKSLRISNHGYFHWRTHIASFITNNWEHLFDSSCKRKKNVNGSFTSILSCWNNVFFESGNNTLKESGWWRLSNGFSPALIQYLYSEYTLWKQRERKNSTAFAPDKATELKILQKILSGIGFDHLLDNAIELKSEQGFSKEYVQSNQDSNPSSPKSEVTSEVSNSVDPGSSDIDEYFSNYLMDCDDSLMMGNFDDILLDFDEVPKNQYNTSIETNQYNTPKNDSNIFEEIKKSPTKLTKINTVNQPNQPILCPTKILNTQKVESLNKTKKPYENFIPTPVKSLLSDSKISENIPWLKNNDDNLYENVKSRLTNEYTEVQDLNNLNNVCRKAHFMSIDKKLIRYRAKLALRRLKRNKRVPLFDLDNMVTKLAYYPLQNTSTHLSNERRVLDQFQVSSRDSPHLNFAIRLVGSCEISPFISPYSGKLLKPYIWRDTETVSPWIQLMNDVQIKVNKNKPKKIQSEISSLDYCYVRPQHISSINSLCEHFFWPGIDLSDTLLYPEFSCVVLYKKIVVAFAFLVPDVSLNEAYISFIFTRPEWRKCGIASFMLYHLTQTCIDKDITLHVSASNPAVFLYQKFGFKIEEFLQEFYDKYFPPESNECKHALFLRLSRS
ncbi:ada2a-containing complex component 2 [Arctopsyche grandis]|uniref:ada2a-containing complex component 2 n=1 Tax=Arctopsyche grandis TaxID=121162 RepID=UPI00406D6955